MQASKAAAAARQTARDSAAPAFNNPHTNAHTPLLASAAAAKNRSFSCFLSPVSPPPWELRRRFVESVVDGRGAS